MSTVVLNLRKIQHHPFEPVFADLALLLDAAKAAFVRQTFMNPLKQKIPQPIGCGISIWRSGRDLNPRAAFDDNTISSRARYDHFDTTP